jgi:hypothetical protein
MQDPAHCLLYQKKAAAVRTHQPSHPKCKRSKMELRFGDLHRLWCVLSPVICAFSHPAKMQWMMRCKKVVPRSIAQPRRRSQAFPRGERNSGSIKFSAGLPIRRQQGSFVFQRSACQVAGEVLTPCSSECDSRRWFREKNRSGQNCSTNEVGNHAQPLRQLRMLQTVSPAPRRQAVSGRNRPTGSGGGATVASLYSRPPTATRSRTLLALRRLRQVVDAYLRGASRHRAPSIAASGSGRCYGFGGVQRRCLTFHNPGWILLEKLDLGNAESRRIHPVARFSSPRAPPATF